MLVSISERLLAVGRERSDAAAGSEAAIAALVEWHVDFALRHRPLIVVQDRDWESLPDDARERSARCSGSTSTSGPDGSGRCTTGFASTAPGRWRTRRSA